MKIYFFHKKPFRKDDEAISESFTVLPALAMVLIGLTIFSIILTTAYTSYDYHHDIIDKFNGSKEILNKISSPNTPVTEDGSVFKLKDFYSKEASDFFNQLLIEYKLYGYNFTIKLKNKDKVFWNFNTQYSDNLLSNTYACTKTVSIAINELQIVPGSLTVIFWNQTT